MINILVVLGIISIVVVVVALKSSNQPKPYIKKCGCNKTKDVDGYCDGSHPQNNTPSPTPTPDSEY